MTTITLEANENYAATIIRYPDPYTLDGLDNLEGLGVFGSQVLSQKVENRTGTLGVYFGAETRLSHKYASANNLYRDASLNADETTGYLEQNRRVRAIKLRGHRSDALILPVDSLAVFGASPDDFSEGDVFDHVNGFEVCRKHEIQKPPMSQAEKKLTKAFQRVTGKVFPEHFSTANFFRNQDHVKSGREVVLTQKLHGTSGRFGRVPVLRSKKWTERILNKFGIDTPDYTYDDVYGSRKVIKGENGKDYTHFYASDIWGEVASEVAGKLPDGYIVYGEIVGWTSDGSPIQSNYTYNLAKGTHELYVYRVAVVNADGVLADLSWDAVREFCVQRGLKHVPEIGRINLHGGELLDLVASLMDRRFATSVECGEFLVSRDQMIPLSDAKTVDEGVCLRQESLVPVILKAKSPIFLAHETKLLDKEVVDLESVN